MGVPGSGQPISGRCPVTYRAGRLKVRQKAMAACAKSRQTPKRRWITSDAERSDRPEKVRYSILLCTQSQMACTRGRPCGTCPNWFQAKFISLSESQYRLGNV